MHNENLKPEEIEIYRQHVEDSRFYYGLEWGLFKWGVALTIFVLSHRFSDTPGLPELWQFVGCGVILVLFSMIMAEVGSKGTQNRRYLKEYSTKVGDHSLRTATHRIFNLPIARAMVNLIGIGLSIVGSALSDFDLSQKAIMISPILIFSFFRFLYYALSSTD